MRRAATARPGVLSPASFRFFALAAAAATLAFAPAARAQVDYGNPWIGVAVSQTQIRAHANTEYPGIAGTNLIALTLDSNGRVVFNDSGTVAHDLGIYAVDLSGPTPVFETVILEADLLAVSNGTDIFVHGIAALPDGMGGEAVFVSQSNMDDDVFRIAGGPVTNIGESNGMVTLRGFGSTLFIAWEDDLGTANDRVQTLPVTGGASTLLADNAAITAVTGGADVDITDIATTPTGDLLLFSGGPGGTNDVVRVAVPGGAVSIFADAADFGAMTPGVTSMTMDANGTLYLWNEFPNGDRANARLTIREAGGTFHSIPMATLCSALGLPADGSQFDIEPCGMAARVVNADETILYVANADADAENIVQFRFLSAPIIELRADDPAYDGPGFWEPGDQGGQGWDGGWAFPFGSSDANAGFFIGSSANNGDGDNNADGDIDTTGESFGLYAAPGFVSAARRFFAAPLTQGNDLELYLDTGFIEAGGMAGVRFWNVFGLPLLDVFFVGGDANYTVSDAFGPKDSGLPFTDEGVRLRLTALGASNYTVRLSHASNPALAVDIAGTLRFGMGEQGIRGLYAFVNSAGAGPAHDFFFNGATAYLPVEISGMGLE